MSYSFVNFVTFLISTQWERECHTVFVLDKWTWTQSKCMSTVSLVSHWYHLSRFDSSFTFLTLPFHLSLSKLNWAITCCGGWITCESLPGLLRAAIIINMSVQIRLQVMTPPPFPAFHMVLWTDEEEKIVVFSTSFLKPNSHEEVGATHNSFPLMNHLSHFDNQGLSTSTVK